MGRKIPGKKHHGVKDPEKQRAVKQNSLKHKINAPPKNPDDQPIPKSLQKIIDLKNEISSGHKPLNKKLTSSDKKLKKPLKRLGRPVKPAPEFKQLPEETNKEFLDRVNVTVEDYLKEAQFEEKFGVSVQRNAVTGDVEDVVKKSKDEFNEILKEARTNKTEKKSKRKTSSGPQLTKSQKRKVKLNEKKEKKKEDSCIDFRKFSDLVKFGEVAKAPPTLSAPKKAEKHIGAPRPGRKNLLLKTVFISAPTSETEKPAIKTSTSTQTAINKKGKRKDLPVAVRRQLDTYQNEVVNAYKKIKADRMKGNVYV